MEDDPPVPRLVSAELSDATIRFLKENLIGDFKVQIGSKTRQLAGEKYLEKLAKEFGFDPPRETTPDHEDRIDVSFEDNEISR